MYNHAKYSTYAGKKNFSVQNNSVFKETEVSIYIQVPFVTFSNVHVQRKRAKKRIK